MRVVIVGGGNVGFTSAEALCRFHDVLVIEKDTAKADKATTLAGYGITASDLEWDDYAELDVKDKIVVVLVGFGRVERVPFAEEEDDDAQGERESRK